MEKELIAPCGMNCGICRAYLREKNPCHGCYAAEKNKPKTRVDCKIRNCTERKSQYCFDCPQFPCDRIRHLDQRYRERYGMSEMENLEMIRDKGLGYFLENEERRWINAEGTYCVHDRKRYKKI